VRFGLCAHINTLEMLGTVLQNIQNNFKTMRFLHESYYIDIDLCRCFIEFPLWRDFTVQKSMFKTSASINSSGLPLWKVFRWFCKLILFILNMIWMQWGSFLIEYGWADGLTEMLCSQWYGFKIRHGHSNQFVLQVCPLKG